MDIVYKSIKVKKISNIIDLICSLLVDKKITLEQFIDQSPKVELHNHLEGMMDTILFNKLKANTTFIKNFTGDPFTKFNLGVDLLCSNFEKNIKLLLEYVFEDRYKQNIIYTEFQYSALKINSSTNKNVIEQFNIINSAINKIKKDDKYKNIEIRFILDIPRGNANTYSYFSNYASDIIATHNKYPQLLIGIGIGGRNESNTIENYKYYFDQFNNIKSLIYNPHAGEFGSTSTIKTSLETVINSKYNIKRIGHGIRIVEIQNKKDLINKLKQKNIYLDVSITSNNNFITDADYTKYVSNYGHPIKELMENDIKVTLSSDDPGILDANLNNEYKKLLKFDNNYLKALPNNVKSIKELILLLILNGWNYIKENNILKNVDNYIKQIEELYKNIED
jgi:adenosine deaminase